MLKALTHLGLGMVLLLCSCARLPKDPYKPISYGLPPQNGATLVEAKDEVLAGAKEGESAFMLIPNNRDALRWRLAMIDQAEHSIDVQVFIWTDDESGRVLFDRLLQASERGVRVRILIDDMPKGWSDKTAAIVDRLEGIQVRKFNPGKARSGLISRMLHFSTQFRTLNRRMHNKQILVDGSWAILGGRNIGNPYFGLSEKYNNKDLDLLITGPVLSDLAEDFDEYWNSDAAYPGHAMHRKVSDRKRAKVYEEFLEERETDDFLLRTANIPVMPIEWDSVMDPLPETMIRGTTMVFQDSPTVRGTDRGVRLVDQLYDTGIKTEGETIIITPYMIPTEEIPDRLIEIRKEEDRRVRILVPSMHSNNHTMVHSHYRKYRKKLLKAGVELYELQGDPSEELREYCDARELPAKFVSLHAKGFIFDRRWLLLGSLNMDPRSIEINTENMLVIDSPELAEEAVTLFDRLTENVNSWKVSLDESGQVMWKSDEKQTTFEPNRGFRQRFYAFLYRWLPIESRL